MATRETSGRSRPSRRQVDADEDVEFAAAEIAEDFDAVERFDFGVQVAAADSDFCEIFGEVFGHAFGQRGDEHAFVSGGADSDFFQ